MLKPNDAILLDIGGRKDGYPSDMTRVGTIGKVDPEFDKVHAVVDAAVKAAVAAAKPGVPASVVDKAARDVITAAGYGEFFLHRTGHGLGIDVHEPPYITGTSERLLEEGNVFSIEPGVYLAGRFGIRLEEIVILRKGSCRNPLRTAAGGGAGGIGGPASERAGPSHIRNASVAPQARYILRSPR